VVVGVDPDSVNILIEENRREGRGVEVEAVDVAWAVRLERKYFVQSFATSLFADFEGAVTARSGCSQVAEWASGKFFECNNLWYVRAMSPYHSLNF
jgi:hypothetical protein